METENGNVQENRYDVENLRFELLENGKRTGFVYHHGELLHEEGGNEKQTSYHLGAGIDAFQRGQELYYYQQDEQLSTAFIAGGNGEIQSSYQYDAFGAEVEANEQFPNRIRYTGQQFDELTRQYYLRARYYNPVLGRFMQEDVYQGDGLNLYAYRGNNPVTNYDPSGYIELETPGYYVYGLFDIGSDTPYYVGITNDLARRRSEHIASGRLNADPQVSDMFRLDSDVLYGEARGYEQYYIDTYIEDRGIIGEPISPENRGNKYNSYNRDRRNDEDDYRAQYFENAYHQKEQEQAESEANKGGSGCQK